MPYFCKLKYVLTILVSWDLAPTGAPQTLEVWTRQESVAPDSGLTSPRTLTVVLLNWLLRLVAALNPLCPSGHYMYLTV